MRRAVMALAASVVALTASLPARAQDLPAAEARAEDPFEPLYPLIGRTWRGTNRNDPIVEDVVRWEWAVGGHAVRAVHSVNGGVYGGETLIFPDRDSGQLIFHYFTSGGFHTTGTMEPLTHGAMAISETVHGVEGLEVLRSTIRIMGDGTYLTHTQVEREGQWVEFGGFDYRIDGAAVVVSPARAAEQASVETGGLILSRRIVADSGEPGDVAAYLSVTGEPDRLVSVTCACAERVELHRIARSGEQPAMISDAAWDAPVDIRPGSPLHLMLIGFDPARATDGQVMLTLTFERAGPVEAAFELTPDSRSAWARFD